MDIRLQETLEINEEEYTIIVKDGVILRGAGMFPDARLHVSFEQWEELKTKIDMLITKQQQLEEFLNA